MGEERGCVARPTLEVYFRWVPDPWLFAAEVLFEAVTPVFFRAVSTSEHSVPTPISTHSWN
jgi:hypothetical protein